MFKSGFVSIIGRPNVGKSTLMNAIVGEKISIITPKPQTTRNRIKGIKNLDNAQIVFLDTPGIHQAFTVLNRAMVETAKKSITGVDIIAFVTEAHRGFTKEDQQIAALLKKTPLPVIHVINKIDLTDRTKIKEIKANMSLSLPAAATIPISALHGEGTDVLLKTIVDLLPEGPPLFPKDMVTDITERFITAEIIREKIMLFTHEEVPYSTAVTVESFKELPEKNLLTISAVITVEKDSQKAIMIGKKGEMLKKIGTEARKELENFFGTHVFLELFVRVRKKWTSDESMIRELGYKE
ncbi:MAG: GTPase Era [Syntrophales bacterium]|nr:GTPase Era [Syntrophales bacterium]